MIKSNLKKVLCAGLALITVAATVSAAPKKGKKKG